MCRFIKCGQALTRNTDTSVTEDAKSAGLWKPQGTADSSRPKKPCARRMLFRSDGQAGLVQRSTLTMWAVHFKSAISPMEFQQRSAKSELHLKATPKHGI